MKNTILCKKFLLPGHSLSYKWEHIKMIYRRFGFRPDKQVAIMQDYIRLVNSFGMKPTFFIPAVILDKHVSALKAIDCQSLEWGINGLVRIDYQDLDYEEQKKHIEQAVEIFDRHGFDFSGFRCPYLKHNDSIYRALAHNGRFVFDSSHSIIWKQFYNDQQLFYSWLVCFYEPNTAEANVAVPMLVNGIIELPVSLPDDDVLLDRNKWNIDEVEEVWKCILKECHQQNALFVVQLHPERFREMAPVLQGLLKQADRLDPPIWKTSLGEIARWEKSKERDVHQCWPQPFQGALCVTGDICAITRLDFFIE